MNLLELQSDPSVFQQEICLATGSGPCRFGDCMADFQRERFAAVNPSLAAVLRHEAPPIPRVWDERTKGASKDTDWTINLLWLLAFTPRALRMQIGAFDQAQADEVRLIVKDLLRADGAVNAFLRQVIEVQSDKIINPRTGSFIEILTSDQFGSHGARSDVLLLNELTHQPSSGFAETLFDNLDKMPNALGIVVSNSGHDPSWQLEWKRVFQETPDRWLVLEYNRPAPWVSEAALAEAEKRNPLGRFQRLWHGVWTPEEGSPALSSSDIAAAFDSSLRPLAGSEAGWDMVAGIDLGVSRNHSALVVLAVRRSHDGHGQIRLADLRAWKPQPGRRVDLQAVEDALIETRCRFNLKVLVFDPWQCLHLAQRVQAAGLGRMVRSWTQPATLQLVEATPTQSNLQKIATATLEAFGDRRVSLFEDRDLRRDLTLLQLVERPNQSFRLVSPTTSDGSHGDLGTAFSLAMLAASELAGKRKIVAGTLDAAAPGAGPMERRLARVQRQWDGIQRERERLAGMSERQFQIRKAIRQMGGARRLF